MSEVVWTKEYKIERYKKMNKTAEKGKIVFAGSSLMEMFPIEQFVKEDTPDIVVYNRGIGGFVTEELLENIDTCIIDLQPSKLFINIGTNDLSDSRRSFGEIFERYEKILSIVTEKVDSVSMYLMAYYPVNFNAATEEMKPCLQVRSNEKIKAANDEVARLARKFNANYIDVSGSLKDENGDLRAEFTIEGMHINERGYRAVYPLIKQYI